MENVSDFSFMEQDRPVLRAQLRGGAEYPDIQGTAFIYTLPNGMYISLDFTDLPPSGNFAIHVHEGLICDNPGDKLLPLPNMVSDINGKASSQLYIDTMNSTMIAGKPIMLHLIQDDKEINIACAPLERIL